MLSLRDIEKARKALAGVARETPLLLSHTVSDLSGAQVFLKAENMQRTGSFKIRGAYVKIAGLTPEDRARGVIAASAGNHAQGVAVAASIARIRATVVMPETASLPKVMATKRYGANVILHGRNYGEAFAHALDLQRSEGLTFIHPFDDWEIMSGQGTVGIEILEKEPDLDAIVVPVGGGGLIAGIATAVKGRSSKTKVIGVQSAGAPSCFESFKSGALKTVENTSTIADGIAIESCGQRTFSVIQRLVDDVVTVEDDAIVHCIVLLLERMKLLVEGAGAVGLAAVLTGKLSMPGQRIAIVLSGGNIDVNLLARVIEHGLTSAGRFLVVRVRLVDQPGQLLKFLEILAQERVNILNIEHHRAGLPLPVNQAEVELTLETRDAEHCAKILNELQNAGYHVWRT